MSNCSDPNDITEALDAAIDAFNGEGHGMPTPEESINSDEDWTAQLTKGCKLLDLAEKPVIDGYDTAIIELCFGAIERSLEAYALAEGGDTLRDFHDHTKCYTRAADLGLVSRHTSKRLRQLYDNNRTDSYYGGNRPTHEQADAMRDLARAIHIHATKQILEDGVCVCDRLSAY
ncbi:hypothetical protein AArcSl_3203 [Halalkaliarchaeum desulfuricum]|uniref:DUF8154 domain-containing protein n=1 Tax=Halalkaliarchaeum desulfuricum TaxID=2055893 RepID=A0A343TNY7_9EURY|nr:DNA-binding protein [Halalkaliarchaeum desulfuricum]AUX10809.1 hypothetical protein AArcSl_3203 [Halalkaliarchaeum desulfuricum]